RVERTAEENLRDKLNDAGLAKWQQAFHVAIDRWTSGAAESMLFTVLEPHGISWGDIELTVDLSRLPGVLRSPAAALLLLVLRDLAAGRLPLGFAVNRGMGAVKVDEITITPHGAGTPWGDDPITLPGGNVAELAGGLRSELDREW